MRIWEMGILRVIGMRVINVNALRIITEIIVSGTLFVKRARGRLFGWLMVVTVLG